MSPAPRSYFFFRGVFLGVALVGWPDKE